MDKEFRISITSGTIITAIFIVAGAYVLWLLRDLVLLVLAAIVIASAIEPGIRGLMRRKFNRLFSVITIYLLIIAAVCVVLFFFIPPILNDNFEKATDRIDGVAALIDALAVAPPDEGKSVYDEKNSLAC